MDVDMDMDMEHGTWDMGHGTWDMGHGTWDMGHGTWDMGHGTWDMGHGTWDMGHGTWDMGHGHISEHITDTDTFRVSAGGAPASCACAARAIALRSAGGSASNGAQTCRMVAASPSHGRAWPCGHCVASCHPLHGRRLRASIGAQMRCHPLRRCAAIVTRQAAPRGMVLRCAGSAVLCSSISSRIYEVGWVESAVNGASGACADGGRDALEAASDHQGPRRSPRTYASYWQASCTPPMASSYARLLLASLVRRPPQPSYARLPTMASLVRTPYYGKPRRTPPTMASLIRTPPYYGKPRARPPTIASLVRTPPPTM